MITSPLDYALAYANHGLAIFPCRADKTPLTPNGLKDASRDPAVIETSWRGRPSRIQPGRCPRPWSSPISTRSAASMALLTSYVLKDATRAT